MKRQMKRLILFLLLFSIIGPASVVSAATVAYWRFGDGDPNAVAGQVLPDSDAMTVWRKAVIDDSGNGNSLTTWNYGQPTPGYFRWDANVPSTRVLLTGASNNFCVYGAAGQAEAFTWSAQSNPSGTDINNITPAEWTVEASFSATLVGTFYTVVGRDGNSTVTQPANDVTMAPLYFSLRPSNTAAIQFSDVNGYRYDAVSAPNAVMANQWYHMVGVSDGKTLSLYLTEANYVTTGGSPRLVAQTDLTTSGSTDTKLATAKINGSGWLAGAWTIGRACWNSGKVDRFPGRIDEVRISDTALNPWEFLFPPIKASGPEPADGALHTQTSALLKWHKGPLAADVNGHHVYFGTSFADVNTGTGGTDKGLRTDPNYYVPSLAFGTTYYWRVDEVNLPYVWKGDIWSFMVQPLTAFNPSPPDGAVYVDPNADLSWSPGYKAVSHDVYFGTTDPPPFATNRTEPNYVLPTLAYDTVYYWRVNEVNISEPCSPWIGKVWSFKTRPFIPITDPCLMGWWKFDEGSGTVALDWSGHNYHGTLINGPQWIAGQIGGAVQLDGTNDYVSLPIGSLISTLTDSTFATWVNFSNTGGAWQRIFDFGTGTTVYMFLSPRIETAGVMRFAITLSGNPGEQLVDAPTTLASGWHHVAVTINPSISTITLYLDGVQVGQNASASLDPNDLGVTTQNWLGRSQWAADAYLNGSLDDFRIYNRVLTQDEVEDVMLGDPLLARKPYPTNMSTVDIRYAKPLIWKSGQKAASHHIYFGTDRDAVVDANTSTAGIYRGQQPRDSNTYTPPEAFQWGQNYYWRIDENNVDTTVSKGVVWSFTVADYLVVDDFELYNPNLADVWKPGGKATVGLSTTAHESTQAMAIDYNNTPSPYYSEAYADANGPNSLNFGIDWTVEGVKALGLWFQGIPDLRGSFSYAGTDPLGPYTATISADGVDIWGTSDQFHYAYKQLSDTGYIEARVDNMDNTDVSAKAGLMIRDTLDPNSKYGLVAVTPGSGVIFELRETDNGNSVQNAAVTGITAPHWIRLTRWWDGSYYNLKAEHANDVSGSCANDWTQVGTDVVASYEQGWDYEVYIGLCVTSHSYGVMCDANFSSVTLTPIEGSITGAWQSQDIGIAYNDPEPIYVTLQDNDSNATLYYPGTTNPNYADANATQIGTWTEWNIDLNDFRVQGVTLTEVNKIYVGVGDRAFGSGLGTVYVDDIRLYRPRFVAGKLPQIPADIVYNGVINEEDLGAVTDNWLISDYNVTPQNPGDANLVARYEFEGDFNDSINSYHGEPNNGATTVNDPTRGQVASFDGVDDYVALPIGPLIASLTNSTFMSWVNFSNTGGDWQRIFDFGYDTIVYMFLTPRLGTDGVMRFAITLSSNPGEQLVDAPSTLASGWRHVAVTIDADNDTIRLYLDGMQVGENTAADLTPSSLGNTTNNWLGRSQWAEDAYFMGYLDDFRIYNRALSQGEVAYLAGKPAGIPFRQPLELLLTPADPNINLYNADGKIDFRDFAEFGKSWYYQQVWPTW